MTPPVYDATQPTATAEVSPAPDDAAEIAVLLDNLPVGVALVDAGANVRIFNRRARQMLGFPDHLFDHGMPSLREMFLFNARRGEYGEGDPEVLADQLVERARRREPHHFERDRPDGSVIDIRGEPLPGGGFVTIWTDVTARKRAEREAEARARQLDLVMNNVPGKLAFFDADLRCVYSNERELIFGATQPGQDGKTLRELVGDAVYAQIEGYFHQALAGVPSAYHRAFVRPDGSDGYLQVSTAPHRAPDGEVIGVFTLGQDVTNILRTETALKERNAELEAANQALETTHQQLLQSEKLASIGQLAAGVAHEINNPVGFVGTNLSTLRQYVGSLLALLDTCDRSLRANLSPDSEAMQAYAAARAAADVDFVREDVVALLDESHDGLQRVRQIVQDLRDFSHAGSDDEWQSASLERGLEATANIALTDMKHRVTLVRDYAGIAPVECLPSQLNQVFLNLIVNAGQAIAGAGTITLRTGQGADGVWVEVTDTGCGIPDEHLGRLFDPFFTTKPVGQGTGLGLALSYGIVEKHGGRITVRSTVGEGTTFRVSIPFERPAPA
ncbi:PAS-domain containing protein [Denitromonas iodatirespirans]|uniref:histidine kinase n=1 Tax=Denitromonas iodatirespirans TaxID=2795389 RepID=A0A944HCA3_DENI1|nr:PAS-domain containing protein [Denitromonas iodatirespirans]MBT0962512.1 PAS-domain containing protein [Denitromonas iodatirespirans]